MTTTLSTQGDISPPRERTRFLGLSHGFYMRLASVVGLFAVWEICGLIPISVAFPTFSDTMRALIEMIADGRMIYAFGETLKPLGVGVGISAVFGIAIVSGWASTSESNGPGSRFSSSSRLRQWPRSFR